MQFLSFLVTDNFLAYARDGVQFSDFFFFFLSPAVICGTIM